MEKNQGAFLIFSDNLILEISLSSDRFFWNFNRNRLIGFPVGCHWNADEEIYQAVMQVVSELGYAGATTKQIAEAANVSEVTLFRKYNSKLQLVKQAAAAIVAQTDFEAATQYSGDVCADLLRVVQAYQDSAVQYGRLIFSMVSELPRYPELVDILEIPYEIYSGIGNLFTRYQSEGVLRSEHPLNAVAALLGPMMYSAVLRGAMPNFEIPPLDLQNHVACFVEGRRG